MSTGLVEVEVLVRREGGVMDPETSWGVGSHRRGKRQTTQREEEILSRVSTGTLHWNWGRGVGVVPSSQGRGVVVGNGHYQAPRGVHTRRLSSRGGPQTFHSRSGVDT